MRRSIHALVTLSCLVVAGIAAAEAKEVTVLFGDASTKISNVLIEEGELWLPHESLKQVNGFELKPEGLCSASQCVPIPKDAGWVREVEGKKLIGVIRVADRLSQPVAADFERRLFAFGEVPSERQVKLELGKAPDFAIPDRKGKVVRLSDFRGKKVLLLTWASWCGCSVDLPNWQKVYQELRDKDFELVAAAQDTAGEAACGKFYDRAHATYTTLIDSEHQLTQLYQMVNVPTGVWIDEEGRVARPPEVAYTSGFRLLGQQVGDDRYVPALRDWVEKGEASEYVMAGEALREKLALDSLEERRADVEFRLGAYLYAQGDRAGAREHWQAAQKLDPENWNYHRQDWSFDAKEAVGNWMRKVRSLGGKPYYDPIEFPSKP